MKFAEIVKHTEKLTIDNSPLILTAIGVTGTITTSYLTCRAAFNVGLDVNAGHYEPIMEGKEPEVYEFKDLVRTYWKEFIPAATTGAVTVSCIIFANRIGHRRAAAMAAAYTISERAFDEYREKVVEKLGNKKEHALRDEVAQDRITKNPVGKTEVIITGGGDVLCYDRFTGRYFRSDMETLKKAQNDINYKILNHQYASLSDFYEKLGLPVTSFSEEVGWNSDNLLELLITTTISEDQKPCLAIDFNISPIRNYYRCWVE